MKNNLIKIFYFLFIFFFLIFFYSIIGFILPPKKDTIAIDKKIPNSWQISIRKKIREIPSLKINEQEKSNFYITVQPRKDIIKTKLQKKEILYTSYFVPVKHLY